MRVDVISAKTADIQNATKNVAKIWSWWDKKFHQPTKEKLMIVAKTIMEIIGLDIILCVGLYNGNPQNRKDKKHGKKSCKIL